eukprot:143875-Amphidinium_carterae.1
MSHHNKRACNLLQGTVLAQGLTLVKALHPTTRQTSSWKAAPVRRYGIDWPMRSDAEDSVDHVT